MERPDLLNGVTPALQNDRPETARRWPCAITGRERPKKDLIRLDTLRPTLTERIRADHPDLADDALIARQEVNRYRNLLVEEMLREEHGEFTELDRQVAESIANQDTIAENVRRISSSSGRWASGCPTAWRILAGPGRS